MDDRHQISEMMQVCKGFPWIKWKCNVQKGEKSTNVAMCAWKVHYLMIWWPLGLYIRACSSKAIYFSPQLQGKWSTDEQHIIRLGGSGVTINCASWFRYLFAYTVRVVLVANSAKELCKLGWQHKIICSTFIKFLEP